MVLELYIYEIFDILQSCPFRIVSYGFITLITIFIAQWLVRKSKNLPPGPSGLPIVGYLPFLGKEPHIVLQKLANKYGKIYSLYLGNRLVIVLGDHATVKEALNNAALLGRPDMSPIQIIRRKSISIVNGKDWQEQKNFISYLLRDIGLGKCFMESHITDEMLSFIEILDKEVGKPCDFHNLLLPSTCNVISALVFGRRFPYNDSAKKRIDHNLNEIFSLFGQTAVYSFIPWLTKILINFGLLNFDKAKQSVQDLRKYIKEEIDEHKKSVDPNKMKDFINAFLVEMENKGNRSTFTEDMLIGNIQTLFNAGSETIRIAISWSLLTMASYPEYQRQVQKEIDTVISKNKYPSWSDHWSMPYTASVLMEVQRWKTTIPINLLRFALEDTVINGYNIPKGSTVMVSLWNVHNDANFWKNPNIFYPDRFLNEEKNGVLKLDGFMPLSIGKRSCPADSMAKMEIFLYFTYILQRYNISFPKGFEHDMQGEAGVFFRPKPFKLCFTRR